VVLAFVLAVGGIVAIGISGRADGIPGASPSVSSARNSPNAVAATQAVQVSPSTAPVRFAGPEMSSAPGPLQLVAQRQLDSVFVHGDVFAPGVTWVYLSLKDPSGRIAGWASVSAPGGVGSRDDDGPTMRFDLQLAAPDANFPSPLELVATAYGKDGATLASASIEGLHFLFIVPIGAEGASGPGGEASVLEPPALQPPAPDVGWPPSRSLGPAIAPVTLCTPARAASAVATRGVMVAGGLRIKAAWVRIALETLSREVLDEVTIDTTDPNGGIRPVQTPTFAVELALGDPRPIGARLVVIVTAYDADGTPLGLVRRIVTVAPLAG
jgi:hypothetical protein